MAIRSFKPRMKFHTLAVPFILKCPSCGSEVELLSTDMGGPDERVGTCCGYTFETDVVRVRLTTLGPYTPDEVYQKIENANPGEYELELLRERLGIEDPSE